MKRLQRFKLIYQRIILLVILSFFFVISSVTPAKADSFSGNEYVYYYTSNNIRGTASGYRETIANYYVYNDPTNLKYKGVVNINFAGPVTGTFTLGLPVQFNSSDVVVTENCVINSNSSTGTWTFRVDGVDSCTVEYYTVTTGRGLSSFSGSWEVSTDLNDINTTLGQIKTYIDGVETLLGQIRTATNYKIEPYQHAAWIYSSKYDSSFPRWKYGLPYMNYSTSYNNQAYTAAHGIRLATGYSYAMMFYSSKALSASDITLYYNGTADVSISTIPINEINSQLYLMGIIFKNNRNGFSSFEAEFGQDFELYPLYFGLTNNMPDEIRALFGLEYDNTYTRLLQQIVNGIGNISSEQITENQTNINNYNSYMTSINNVENNYYSDYDVNNININDSHIFDFSDGVSSDSIIVFNNQLNNLMNIKLIKWPIRIILLGLILVIILG